MRARSLAVRASPDPTTPGGLADVSTIIHAPFTAYDVGRWCGGPRDTPSARASTGGAAFGAALQTSAPVGVVAVRQRPAARTSAQPRAEALRFRSASVSPLRPV